VHQVEHEGLRVTRDVSSLEGGEGVRRTLRVTLRFEHRSEASLRFRYRLDGPAGPLSRLEDGSGGDLFLARGVRSEAAAVEVETCTATSITSAPWEKAGSVVWAAAGSGDTLAALWCVRAVDELQSPIAGVVASAERVEQGDTARLVPATALESRVISLAPGGDHVEEYLFYAGPRDPAALAALADADRLRLREANQIDVDLAGRFRLTVDSATGALAAVYLLEYFEESPAVEPRRSYRLILEPRQGPGFLGLERIASGDAAAESAWNGAWTFALRRLADGGEEVVLEKRVGDVRIRKRISAAAPGDFAGRLSDEVVKLAEGKLLRVSLELENLGRERVESFSYRFYGPSAIATSSRRTPGGDLQIGVGWRSESGRVLTQIQDPPGEGEEFFRQQDIAWLALVNSYFTALLFPLTESAVGIVKGDRVPYPSDDARLAKLFTLRTWCEGRESLQPAGRPRRFVFGLYLGPRESEFLAQADALSLAGVNDYGWWSGLIHFFIWLLGALRAVAFGNWGLGIIVLTLLVKLCLHPINRKSQRSMMRFQKKMQKIQPQMKELQAKYASDRMRYSQEVQRLWKQHGVNPGQGMLSCLVMFLQLPVWISLYYSLEYAIGLRQATFLYIDDLTLPDALFPLPFAFAIFGADFSTFNLLPVLYVILSLVNQRLQPRPEDPNLQAQYRMMTFMLVFFGFIFYSFPAGFMLYIMTSSALGIVESKIIKAQLRREDEKDQARASAAPAVAVSGARPALGGGARGDLGRKGRHRRR
jgi:YidC/Oxa1 family membrane protein insertase